MPTCLWRAGLPGQERKSCVCHLVRKPEEASGPSGRRTSVKASIPWASQKPLTGASNRLLLLPWQRDVQHNMRCRTASAGVLLTAAPFPSASRTLSVGPTGACVKKAPSCRLVSRRGRDGDAILWGTHPWRRPELRGLARSSRGWRQGWAEGRLRSTKQGPRAYFETTELPRTPHSVP